jgi:DNA-binding transcriptional MerR regulator
MAEKMYYSMGEVAEMLDVSQSLLRFWEKRFDIIAPRKNKKGNRLFSPEDVRNLKTIYHLVKERGMTLAGAEKQLRARRSAIERDMEIAERLNSIRALLVEVRNELGGGGVIVEDESEVVEPIAPVVEPKPEIAPEPEPIITPEPEPEPEQKKPPVFIEQTLF